MANSIKYNTSSESNALTSGNFHLGIGDVPKGPTSSTGYWAGINPPSGGYTIYFIGGQSFTTAAQCKEWFAGQNDKMLVNREYEKIVTDGLVFMVDAGFTPSYPTTGTDWYDLSGNGNDGTLTNGPTFDSGNGGSIVFDGSDDYMNTSAVIKAASSTDLQSFCSWLKGTSTNNSFFGSNANGAGKFHLILNFQSNGQLRFAQSRYGGGNPSTDETNIVTVNANTDWNHACIVKTAQYTYDVYFNGELIIENALKEATLDGDFALGKWWSGRVIPSQISNVQIYNRALTSTEVTQNYNAQKGRFGL
jgi:hypothetical protein